MHYRTARQMIWQAYHWGRDSVMAFAIQKARMGADIQLTLLGTQDARICHAIEAGQVMSRVEALPPHLRGLMMVCFTPKTREELADEHEWVAISLYQAVLGSGLAVPGQGKGQPSVEQLAQLRWLCVAAVFHHSETTWPYVREGLDTPHKIRAWLKAWHDVHVDTRRWEREGRVGWSGVWVRLLDVLSDWEGQGLAPVSALLREQQVAYS